jgi:transglutaminase-like putative cysteine protease
LERYFQVSLHALIVSAFLALVLTGRLDFVSILIFTAGAAASFYQVIRKREALLSAENVFYLSCVYIGLFLVDSLHAFIPATIHLVLFLELAKLHQRSKNEKDYLYLIILAFMQVLAASSLTIDISFVATLLLFLIALVSTLMSYDMRRVENSNSAISAGTSSVNDDRKLAASVSGMSIWAAFCIVALGSTLFFLIPRPETGHVGQVEPQSVMLSGFSEKVHLGEIGNVKLNSAVVMRARRIMGVPSAVFKWRGIALDFFDGSGWSQSKSDHIRTIIPRSSLGQFAIHSIEGKGHLARYAVYLEPLATTALFGPHRIVAITGNFPFIAVDHDESVYSEFRSPQRIEYEVSSETPDTKSGAEETADLLSSEVLPNYVQLPADTDPRILRLALDITKGGSSARDKAALVELYLKRNYRYSLKLTGKPGAQPVSTFLFETKSGHCEYFASAMALLLRASGIPTRMVNGFLMGEYNPVGDDYIVRQSDAHSWVEVYLPGSGWTEFDPTPPDPNRKEPGFATQISHYVDAMELFWNSYVLTYDTGSQLQLFRNAQEHVEDFQEGVQTSSYDWAHRLTAGIGQVADAIQIVVEAWWFWIMALLTAGSAIIYKNRVALRAAWQVWRARNSKGPVESSVVEYLFYRAARLAARRGTARQAGQTWREWVVALPDPVRRSALDRALDVFEKTKYGSQPASSSDFAILEGAIRELSTPP